MDPRWMGTLFFSGNVGTLWSSWDSHHAFVYVESSGDQGKGYKTVEAPFTLYSESFPFETFLGGKKRTTTKLKI